MTNQLPGSEKELIQIARTSPDAHARHAALRAIHDQDVLAEFIFKDWCEESSSNYSKYEREFADGLVALENFADERRLVELVLTSPFPEDAMPSAAAAKIADPTVFFKGLY
ncbi:MAG: hypothetical protein LBD67_01850 [Candidatus Accumulibacter sp.]|nr:hypothetical protein [Accumulibacter sp.]